VKKNEAPPEAGKRIRPPGQYFGALQGRTRILAGFLMGGIKYLEAIGRKTKRGRPAAGPAPTKADLARLYVQEGRSVRDTAAALGCTKDAVFRALEAFGIPTRPKVRRSRMQQIPLPALKAAVQEKGVRGAARDLGIGEEAVRRYLKKRGNLA